MNETVIRYKLESLQRCIERIQQKSVISKNEFLSDIDAQDVVILNLERAVQLCVDITGILLSEKNIEMPSTMRAVFEVAGTNKLLSLELTEKMTRAVGFRNLAVHQYQKLDISFVYDIGKSAVTDLRNFMAEVSQLFTT